MATLQSGCNLCGLSLEAHGNDLNAGCPELRDRCFECGQAYIAHNDSQCPNDDLAYWRYMPEESPKCNCRVLARQYSQNELGELGQPCGAPHCPFSSCPIGLCHGNCQQVTDSFDMPTAPEGCEVDYCHCPCHG